MSANNIRTTGQPVQFATYDKYLLSGTYFAAECATNSECAVVFNCGAGVASLHYRHFAKFLAASGMSVLTYDCRGIGRSRPPSLRNFPATIEDWAEYDCSAAVEWMQSRCTQARLIGIGHSIGSVLFGGTTNSKELTGFVMIGAHTGLISDYRTMYRIPMAALWHAAMPIMTELVGFFPARTLRLGEDIPKGVAMQWARSRQAFRSSSVTSLSDRMQRLKERCSQTKGGALIMTFTDDGFATEAGAARVRELFPNLSFHRWMISPPQVGLKRLGHFGFFKRESELYLWPQFLKRLTGTINAHLFSETVAQLDDTAGRASRKSSPKQPTTE